MPIPVIKSQSANVEKAKEQTKNQSIFDKIMQHTLMQSINETFNKIKAQLAKRKKEADETIE